MCDDLTDDLDDDLDLESAAEWYADTDTDGYGDPTAVATACLAPSGHVADDTDCNDTSADVHPGAVEVCNRIDDNCDGLTDDDDPAATRPVWFADTDSDSFGDPASSLAACSAPTGYVADDTDCDDTVTAVHPGALEVCNGTDDNCDGLTDDDDPALDTTTQSTWYADTDADGYGDGATSVDACSAPSGHVSTATDCDDTSIAVNPSATEVCNSIDDDCDGLADDDDPGVDTATYSTWWVDLDADGYGDPGATVSACAQPASSSTVATDCDDSDGSVHPGATEVCDDGVDNDCDGTASGCGLTDTASLADAPLKLIGEEAGDRAALGLAWADLDGDGVDEVVVGAHDHDDSGTDNGRVYVVDASFTGTLDLSAADAILTGAAQIESGWALAAGDTTGDGLDEVAVGAPGMKDSGGTSHGGAYVLQGALSGTADLDTAAVATLLGDEDGAGTAVAWGDVNGDGLADLALTAYTSSAGAYYGGATYMVLGPVTADLDLPSGDAFLMGEGANDGYLQVTTTGDLNADGLADVAIGVPHEDSHGGTNAGTTYVFFGPFSGTASYGDADAMLVGGSVGEQSGSAVVLHDIDNDGTDDAVVGALYRSYGAVDILYGPVSGLTSVGTASTTIEGNSFFGAGYGVGAGDFDDDGQADLVLRARASSVYSLSAVAYFSAPSTGTLAVDTDADGWIEEEVVGDNPAILVGGGHADTDGVEDLLVGAIGEQSGGGPAAGAAYLWLGGGM